MRARAFCVSVVLLLAVVLCTAPAFAANAFVQRAENFVAGSAAPTVTFTNNVAAASCVAVTVFVTADGTTTVSSITSDFGGTWSIRDRLVTTGGGRSVTLAYGYNVTGGAKVVTVNLSASTNTSLRVHEISGCSTSDPIDGSTIQNQTAPGTGTDAVTSGAIVTTVAGAYLYGTVENDAFTTTYTAGTGYTIAYTALNSANEYQIQGSAGSVAATFTSNEVGANHTTGILALKPAVAATVPCIIGGGIIRAGCP